MAHVTTTTSSTGALARIQEIFAGMMTDVKKHLEYRRTLRELSDLDERILADLGLSRHELETVARNATR